MSIPALQTKIWSSLSTNVKISIIIVNLLSALPGIIFFLTKTYNFKMTYFSSIFAISSIIIPILISSVQLRQNFIFGFKLSLSTIIASSISALFYLLSLNASIPSNYKKTLPQPIFGCGILLLTIVFFVTIYIHRYSEMVL